ncbi:TPA: ParA family protein [Clostridioides difficile]|uniref:ParA family protein n=1 Tax=Clostridioides difficile TaxID=1496 RepID=UPI00038CA38E|nr:ParA family protein [Clostridioides difficile]EQI71687.1 cobQ/CobB/MinD/ParA nucleotide binding domain protein [Clostridioides difficile Y381]HEK8692522.1 AAA family ATPase [Clostridioides difficile]
MADTKLIVFFNTKGGIYKTTTTIMTAYELAKDKDKKILLWDLDQQANLTQYVYKTNHDKKTTLDMLKDVKAEEIIIKSFNKSYPNIDLIASDILMAKFERELFSFPAREQFLARWYMNNFDVLSEYDYIFCDLSPKYDLTAMNALFLADSVVILIKDKNVSSLRGADYFKQLWDIDRSYFKKEDNIKATVLVGFEKKRTAVSNTFDSYLKEFNVLRNMMLNTYIRKNEFIEQALMKKLSLTDYTKITKEHFSRQEFASMLEELKERGVL